jgi:hypothetical protein
VGRRSGLVVVAVLALGACPLSANGAQARSGTPAAPTNVKASRSPSGTTARLTFGAAKPRGQKVTGYSALCRAGGPASRYKVVGKHSPATLEGLTPGLGYGCTLQGRSHAGFGAESKPFTVWP